MQYLCQIAVNGLELLFRHYLSCHQWSTIDQPVTGEFDWQLLTANRMWVSNKSALPIPYKSQNICLRFFTASGVLCESLCAVKPWQWSWFVVVFWQLPCLTVWLKLNILRSLSSPNSPRLRNIQHNHHHHHHHHHHLRPWSLRCWAGLSPLPQHQAWRTHHWVPALEPGLEVTTGACHGRLFSRSPEAEGILRPGKRHGGSLLVAQSGGWAQAAPRGGCTPDCWEPPLPGWGGRGEVAQSTSAGAVQQSSTDAVHLLWSMFSANPKHNHSAMDSLEVRKEADIWNSVNQVYGCVNSCIQFNNKL